ncbi:MAG: hypothetical protein J7K40_00110 [candidate division Zixibacteria bacterium]|nr:hypothetical protein [candidate division Zixibacteria bacterium]
MKRCKEFWLFYYYCFPKHSRKVDARECTPTTTKEPTGTSAAGNKTSLSALDAAHEMRLMYILVYQLY